MQAVDCAFSLALFNAGSSIEAKIAMIAITMRSSIRVKILIFTLRSKNIEQGTGKEEVEKHLNNSTMEKRGEKSDRAGIDCVLLWETVPGRELRQISALETKSWRGTRSAKP